MCLKPFDLSCLGQDIWFWIIVIAVVLLLVFIHS